jgi:hypothetical protein
MCTIDLRGLRTGIHRPQSHLAHQAGHALAADLITLALKMPRPLSGAVPRRLETLFVARAHPRLVVSALTRGS